MKRLLFLLILAGLTACEKADHMFSNLPARFTMENIFQAPVLNTACRSMGQFCTITVSGQTFVFRDFRQTTSTVPITGGYVYDGFYLGLSGLIVGLPDRAELGKDQSEVISFDLACSNCYHEFGITKPLQLQENGMARCNSCERTYDLNDLGRTSNGRALERYRVRLLGNTLIVAN